jgi:5'(3')-deoxyribonucleotidase
MQIRHIYLDLDQVFADFHGVVKEVTSHPYFEDPAKTWGVLDKIPNLFKKLKPIDDHRDLFDYVFPKYECTVLTALPLLTNELVTAKQDKEEWVAAYLSPNIKVICTDGWRGKAKYATGPDVLLIDDMERNIQDWVSTGGQGIIHRDAESTIKTLKKIGL